jgi:putative hydroxymethylpyrimidine transport system substrate-binding protein
MTLKEGPVASLADLKGRKIGNSVGGFEDALLGAMLKSAGLALSDVTLVNVNFALAQSLMSGAVDAVIGAYRNYETHILALEGKEPLAFFPEEHGVPMFDELIFVARPDADASKLSAFLSALERAVAFTLNHPDEAWAHYIEGRPQLDDDINKRAYASTLPRFASSPAAADPERYTAFSRFLADGQLIAAARPSADYLWRPGH